MIFVNSGREIKVEIDYEIKHKKLYSESWFQNSDLSWSCYDLGKETDTRSVSLTYRDSNENVIDFEKFLLDKSSGQTQLLEVQLSAGEEFFGSDLVYPQSFFVYVLGSPSYSYESLDFGKLDFTLIIDKGVTPTYKNYTAIDLSDYPWSFNGDRKNKDTVSIYEPYTGDFVATYDEAIGAIFKASMDLDRNQAGLLSRYILEQRISEISIPTTYFKMAGLDRDVAGSEFFKIKDYKESRISPNFYRIEMEILLNV